MKLLEEMTISELFTQLELAHLRNDYHWGKLIEKELSNRDIDGYNEQQAERRFRA